MNITRAAAVLTGEFQAFYTSLGKFTPQRARPFVPYAERVAYSESGKARHRVSVRRSPLRWVSSTLREIGESLIGAFLTPAD